MAPQPHSVHPPTHSSPGQSPTPSLALPATRPLCSRKFPQPQPLRRTISAHSSSDACPHANDACPHANTECTTEFAEDTETRGGRRISPFPHPFCPLWTPCSLWCILCSARPPAARRLLG